MNYINHKLSAIVILSDEFKHIKDDIFVKNGDRYNLGLCFVDYSGDGQTRFEYFVFAQNDKLAQSVMLRRSSESHVNSFDCDFKFAMPENYAVNGQNQNAICFPVLMKYDLEEYTLPAHDNKGYSMETGTFMNKPTIHQYEDIEKIYFKDYVKKSDEKIDIDEILYEEELEEKENEELPKEEPNSDFPQENVDELFSEKETTEEEEEETGVEEFYEEEEKKEKTKPSMHTKTGIEIMEALEFRGTEEEVVDQLSYLGLVMDDHFTIEEVYEIVDELEENENIRKIVKEELVEIFKN